ncbi:hypothetical protein I2F29_11935 [Acinetobacter sp. FNA3]|uniref:CheW-like domain-containing protein n=3 Tax=Gammaproteobacteria TaxID=1236 RepID=A0ABU6DUW0_9GAMM|nr:hypothetical protein [Acinetobacter pollinis]MBF7689336.1 hypothetical protein [Acinetobacter pollinis]MBF7694108.1 hypothetical protein [Acinetobacter pollinis]MBF7696881.1 hypothetical protein [Acinetobacter pollinis]MBF7701689.1 hypothetical protein [Acinetobacter pollinis]MEB5477657.1 hypothetical protein [Acinetobacter pollinis]
MVQTDLNIASAQGLSDLIAVSTGFVDIFKIECHQQPPMILPQNLILSVQSHRTGVKTINWHDLELPVYAIHQPDLDEGTALIVEGEMPSRRFVILCNEMPEPLRLRISEVVDIDENVEAKAEVFQYVSIRNEMCQIPKLDPIYESIIK